MNIKELKKTKEDNIVKVIKSMLDKDTNVQCSYDVSKDIVSVAITSEVKNKDNAEITERLIAYEGVYDNEKDELKLAGFTRIYNYDRYGIAVVVNDMAIVDENLFNGIKGGIKAGLQMDEKIEEPNENAENAVSPSAE